MKAPDLKLPAYARKILNECPHAGQGVHVWLFKVACVLHPHVSEKAKLVKVIGDATDGCGRYVSAREIEDAVTNSEARAWSAGERQTNRSLTRPKWPDRNYDAIELIAREGSSLAELWDSSPVIFGDNNDHTEEIIDELFSGNPLLCCGRTSSIFQTQHRQDWRGQLDQLALIVPSPMSARTGKTKQGNDSPRSLNNTGPRRFLVVEFDFKEKGNAGEDTPDAPLLRSLATDEISVADLCAALHVHLAQWAPLVLAVHSGGKSLHGWFYAAGQPEEKLVKFMRYAASIGADPATWTPCQFVRMPDGRRENGKRQRVYYFNPGILS